MFKMRSVINLFWLLTLFVVLVQPAFAESDFAQQVMRNLEKLKGTADEAGEPTPEALIQDLGDDDFEKRQAATNALIAMGQDAYKPVSAALKKTADPEVRHRLRYILDLVTPPNHGVIVTNVEYETTYKVGSIITRIGRHKIETAEQFGKFVPPDRWWPNNDDNHLEVVVWHAGVAAVMPLSEIRSARPEVIEFTEVDGNRICELVQQYATGYAEKAYETLRTLSVPLEESPLPKAYVARIAYAAGDGKMAVKLLKEQTDVVTPSSTYEGGMWRTPSQLDKAAAGHAPFQLEWELWCQRESYREPGADPDQRVHRVLIPGNRFVDALVADAGYWWSRKDKISTQQSAHENHAEQEAGNMLAYVTRMLNELELQSEAQRLIEPRSILLSRLDQPTRWISQQPDAWLHFFKGDAQAAIDLLHDDARRVLMEDPWSGNNAIRSSACAAQIAFFLCQAPNDSRVENLEDLLSSPDGNVQNAIVNNLILAINEENFDLIRKLCNEAATRQNLPWNSNLPLTTQLLNYVSPNTNTTTPKAEETEKNIRYHEFAQLPLFNAVKSIQEGDIEQAKRYLRFAEYDGVTYTPEDIPLAFLKRHPNSEHKELQKPLMAVPLGMEKTKWIVLTHDRQIVQFNEATNQITSIEKPTPSWFPGPLTFPWLGHDPNTGRAWIYSKRRLVEIPQPSITPIAANIKPEQIADFDAYVSPYFAQFASLAETGKLVGGENGEYWRTDVLANTEYTTNPKLAEIGFITRHEIEMPNRDISDDHNPSVIQVTLRGGWHLLIHTGVKKTWSSSWIAEKIHLGLVPTFFAKPMPNAPNSIALFTSFGFMILDADNDELTQIAIPGNAPYPPVIPEDMPYERNDPRWIYFAKLPAEGGEVYRLRIEDNSVETLSIKNLALPSDFYRQFARCELRQMLDTRLITAGLPRVRDFLTTSIECCERVRPSDENVPE